MNKFKQLRTEWLNRQEDKKIALDLGLLTEQETWYEESFNEDIRQSIEDGYEPDKFYEEMIRECNENIIGKSKETSRNFWKRQLSKTFFNGYGPPCPVLTTLNMQRYDANMCFECHASNTIEDWIEGHTRAMKIMPSQLTGHHMTNCVHNAHRVVKKNLKAHYEQCDRIDVSTFIKEKQNKPSKQWTSTEGIDCYMLNEDNTDTLIIQRTDTSINYANTMLNGQHLIKWTNRWAESEWPRDLNGTVKSIAESPHTLTIAAHELEEAENHDVSGLTNGLIDLHKFVSLATQDFLEVKLETTTETLTSALPSEITTLVLSGSGLINAIELTWIAFRRLTFKWYSG